MTSRANTYEYDATTKPRLNGILGTPWRYRCPDCDSTTVIVRELSKPKAFTVKQYKEYEPINHRHAADHTHIHDFICHECGAVFDEPYDAKNDECHLIHEVS